MGQHAGQKIEQAIGCFALVAATAQKHGPHGDQCICVILLDQQGRSPSKLDPSDGTRLLLLVGLKRRHRLESPLHGLSQISFGKSLFLLRPLFLHLRGQDHQAQLLDFQVGRGHPHQIRRAHGVNPGQVTVPVRRIVHHGLVIAQASRLPLYGLAQVQYIGLDHGLDLGEIQ